MEKAGTETWNKLQERTFLRWMNRHLSTREMNVERITDLKSGVLLCHLLEIISGKEVVGFHNHPKGPHHELDNCHLAIRFLQGEGIKTVNIGGQDIHDGNVRICLGLIWTLVLRYLICKNQAGDQPQAALAVTEAKSGLLEWVNGLIGQFGIKNLTTDWNDGRAICALTNALRPGSCDLTKLDPRNARQNCELGIDLAEKLLGIPKLILGEEMQLAQVDEHAMMAYLSQFRDVPAPAKEDFSGLGRASGPGLESGVKCRPCSFDVSFPGHCNGQLKVVAEGKVTIANVQVVDNGQGQYSVGYVPGEEGVFTVSVTLNDKHIPGSPFSVPIAPGGVRVFFSTAKSGQREALVKTERGIPHNQWEDFSRWVPIDSMQKDHLSSTISNTKGKVRAFVVVLDDDVAMSSFQPDLNHILSLAKAGQPSSQSRALTPADFVSMYQVPDEQPPSSLTIHTSLPSASSLGVSPRQTINLTPKRKRILEEMKKYKEEENAKAASENGKRLNSNEFSG